MRAVYCKCLNTYSIECKQKEVKVLDMADLDGSNNVRMIMRFTSAVQFGIASDLVEYA